MTKEEAIWYLEPIANSSSLVRYKEALGLAISVLRAQQERENPKPLTLDELRRMDGEPVWLHTFSSVQKKTNISQWAILESTGNSNAVFLKGGCSRYITKLFCDYGTTWLAYRHKPKEETA